MKSVTYMLVVMLLVTFVSSTVTAQSVHPYFPLNVGLTMDWDSDVSPYTEKVVSESQSGGLTWYKFDTFWRWDNTEVAIDGHGDMYLKRDGNVQLWIKLDAQRGASWTAAMPGAETWTAQMTARDITLTTISGTYNDVVQIDFIWSGADNDLTVYYAPGIGPIKRILKGFGVLTDELITSSTGIDTPRDFDASMVISDIYPQPARDFVNLNISMGGLDRISYVVRDLLGREVFNGVTRAELPGLAVVRIPTIGLRAGVYFVRIANGAATKTAHFFVK